MSFINSRKHASPSRLSVAVAGALLLPGVAAQAQAQTTASTLPAVEIKAGRETTYKAERASSPKYSQPLVDTPQTLTVIKRELIDQQAATNLTEALQNSPGVGTFFLGENGSTSTGDTVFMRGFDASSAIFVDNVRDLGAISRDVFNVEQMEVLKGPAGADNGRGSPTGSINLVTRQPQLVNAFHTSATYGSWGRQRITADWNRLLDEPSGTALRLNLMKQNYAVPGRHEVRNDRFGVAPALAFGLNGATRVFVNFQHVEQDNVPDGGIPTIGLPGYTSPDPARPFLGNAPRVDPANFYGNVRDYNRVNADMYTVRVEHDLASGAKLQNTTRYARTDQDYRLSSFLASGLPVRTAIGQLTAGLVTPSATDRSTWTLARNIVTRRDQSNEILTNQSNLSTGFTTGSIGHTLVAGLELTRERQQGLSFSASGSRPAANLYQPDPDFSEAALRITPTGRNRGQTDTVALYVFDTLRLDERWSVNLGVREDLYRTRFDSTVPGTANLSTSGKLFNWKLAGIYKPTADSSLYALYATSQQPPGGANFQLSSSSRSAANPDYAPQKTRTAEIGTKWDLLDKRLAVTAALYRTEVSNEVEEDITSGRYYQTGKKTVQGVELGVTGELTRNLALTAGYTRTQSRVARGKIVTASGENSLNYTPPQAFTSWLTWRLPQGWSVGGGARYVAALQRDASNTPGSPASSEPYWVVDGMASYVVNSTLDLQFNVNNLLNKRYVASINRTGYRYLPGTARAISLTANLKF